MRKFIFGVVLGIALASGALTSLWVANAGPTRSPNSGIWADACVVTVQDASLYFPGWGYGSIKYVGAFVGNYNGRYLSDGFALNAVSAFDCQRVY